MPSKYLFLANGQRTSGDSVWTNIPTLSSSTRECYLTMVNAKIVFSAEQLYAGILVKMFLPSGNHVSTDNETNGIVVGFLETTDNQVYSLPFGNEVHLLTNDNIKNATFSLESNSGALVSFGGSDNMEVLLKLDYVDQQAVANQYIEEIPRHLGGL